MAEEAPRWLDRQALAAFVSMRVDYIPRLVKAGKLPAPSHHLGPKSPCWDRHAVDAAFEGGAGPGPRAVDEFVHAAVERTGREEPNRRRRRW